MATYTWDHIHLRTANPEAMAQWFEKMLGAEVKRSMQQGKERIATELPVRVVARPARPCGPEAGVLLPRRRQVGVRFRPFTDRPWLVDAAARPHDDD